MWTRKRLQAFIKEKMQDYLFIVVSNREPYVHKLEKGQIKPYRGAGGVITALDPVMQACNGIWVAHGSGEADRRVTDRSGKVSVPPDNPKYTLKRVWLTKEEEDKYYYGYSNEALWPLCHHAFQRPTFKEEDWEFYKRVNRKFADAVIEEIGDKKAFVWIQDYHLTLLPKYLKEMAPNQLITAHFWHIPWPSHETFRICPHRKEIIEGLLSNDLLGFHIRYFCDNFFDTVDREVECIIDRERLSVSRGGKEVLIRPYAISVDFEGINELSRSDKVAKAENDLREELGVKDMKVLLGLDRIDYTKGIPERLMAVDRLLDNRPELKEKVVFMQMGQVSRIHIPQYKILNDEINAMVEQINWKHSTEGWEPIIMIRRHLTFPEIIAFFRIGSACVVSSLHDGMNLVAKEFISARSDEKGMLILSQFTGASRELTDSFLINPFDQEQFSQTIHEVLNTQEEEASKRMLKLREQIKHNNIFRWAGRIVSDLLRFDFKEE